MMMVDARALFFQQDNERVDLSRSVPMKRATVIETHDRAGEFKEW